MSLQPQDLDGLDGPDGDQPTPRDQTTSRLTRGTARMLRHYGDVSLAEFKLGSGRRVDLIALDGKGRVTIIEVKSSVPDFRSDAKWPSYLEFCDFFYFAVAPDFPREILPGEVGLIAADGYGAEILHPSPDFKLNGARRRKLQLQFAQTAARRLQSLVDVID